MRELDMSNKLHTMSNVGCSKITSGFWVKIECPL